MEKNSHLPLYATKSAKARIPFQLFALLLFVGVCFIFVYRVSNIPSEEEAGRWAWIGLFLSELWFCLYWFITVIVRWNPIYRCTFKDRLSLRYEEALPGIDIFVCTADPMIEPPAMVINTVLSVMAYDYPPQKLNVYLSDDGGSDLTFYAMVEASSFSKIWLPFCKKFKIEPRSPEAYFRTAVEPLEDHVTAKEWSSIKKSYEGMKKRIETTTKLGRTSEEIRKQHKGFREWNLVASRRDHQTILQILIDGKDPKAVDIEGQPLPTLVYLAREKRPQYHHNFKAGAMNALIRVSSRISNSPIILNLDCDMYSNNSESVRDAVCFYMDEEKGHEVGFVQFPQSFENITKNDVYGSSLNVIMGVEIPGFDGNGGPLFIGTGCFHRRNALCGQKYSDQECKVNWKEWNGIKIEESAGVLEDTSKVLASCTYEEKYTQWGNEVGLKYGCPVEDVLSGLAVHYRGWRSIYFNPARKGFIGLPPTTLLQSLVQHKRWSEVPSLCLLRGISLFPKLLSAWMLPFAFVIIFHRAYSLGEFLWFGGTVQGWWNDQRMWLFRRISSYIFGFLDYILKLVGFSKSAFVVTEKVADDDVSERYEQELMEFGASSPMFTIIATLALVNVFCLVGGMKKVIRMDVQSLVSEPFTLQILLCALLVLINLPVYQGLFLRKDKGRMPTSVTQQSVMFALLACALAMY
ncbi:cellulose synthase-like protein E6 isoform X2 [Juglans microcarpa x Juglans regia]|uniref:cellulose synthase-like protein E6 isoform X2 n=1 Tax=Juglans microcarpa x Juglans regia TaxID=2249226 RepID=UPI001B7EB008|nr:cellulose synthase-like protein E6 isoform X2 [Juglans microcarpa x Juglans regia]